MGILSELSPENVPKIDPKLSAEILPKKSSCKSSKVVLENLQKFP